MTSKQQIATMQDTGTAGISATACSASSGDGSSEDNACHRCSIAEQTLLLLAYVRSRRCTDTNHAKIFSSSITQPQASHQKSDQDQSRPFYIEGLGLQISSTANENGVRWHAALLNKSGATKLREICVKQSQIFRHCVRISKLPAQKKGPAEKGSEVGWAGQITSSWPWSFSVDLLVCVVYPKELTRSRQTWQCRLFYVWVGDFSKYPVTNKCRVIIYHLLKQKNNESFCRAKYHLHIPLFLALLEPGFDSQSVTLRHAFV